MGDEDDLPEPQLGDDGVKVTDLIVGRVRVAGRLSELPHPRKSNNTTRRGGER